jgi:predicted O-linked N-acetylglucosamine transferase (SPINDLY family)
MPSPPSDIALQPFPYCGGVTLLEGLFMGVPSIAMTGRVLPVATA